MKTVFAKEQVAKELVKVAQLLTAAPPADEGEEVEDPQFTQKVAELRAALPSIRSKKRMKLNRFGVSETLRPATTTVEQVVDILLRVANA